MTITIYIDRRYDFTTAHVHGDLYRERGLLTSEGKEMKRRKVFLILSEAICLPKKVTICISKDTKKEDSSEATSNGTADFAQWEMVLE